MLHNIYLGFQSDRMIADMAVELKDTGVSCLTLWPGTVMTENMVDILNGANDFSFLKEVSETALSRAHVSFRFRQDI